MVNRQDENLGKIHELVIDAEDCLLVYVVLSIGGFLGMGNKLFAMPWKAFEFDNNNVAAIRCKQKKAWAASSLPAIIAL